MNIKNRRQCQDKWKVFIDLLKQEISYKFYLNTQAKMTM